jgi:GNAT superfamily N-acetyltransferase
MDKFIGLYDIRDFKESDANFIYASFLKGLYYGDSWFSSIPKDIFMENYKKVIQVLIKKSEVKIACLKDEPDVIIGYSILSIDYQTIHFVYVKEKWRNRGIGKSLLPQYPSAVTHLTTLGKKLLNKINNPIFNPFL